MKRKLLLSSLGILSLAFAGSAAACGDVDDSQAHATPSAFMASAPAASQAPTPTAKAIIAKASTKSTTPKAVDGARAAKVASAKTTASKEN